MIRWNRPLAAFALAAFALAGCSDSQQLPTEPMAGFDTPTVTAPAGMSFSLMPASATPAEVGHPLVAGQNEVVGSVFVSNDTESLYVRYEIDDPTAWCITEMHLAVTSSYEDIPQTNGNPVPGQFPYSYLAEPDCLSEYTFPPIPLDADWNAGDDLHIAAHAVVAMPVAGCTETVWQIGEVEESVLYPDESGPFLTNYADEFNWSKCDPAPTPYTTGASLLQCAPGFTNPFYAGSTPDADFPYNANYNRDYATDLDVVWTGALWFGGSLQLSWSPGLSAQETKVVSDGVVIGTFNATGVAQSGMGWFLDAYPLVENSASVDPKAHGDHTLNFAHTRGDGTFWDWIRLEQPCIEYETAWAGVQGEDTEGKNDYGFDFPGRNWATYVQYEVQGFCPAPTVSGDVSWAGQLEAGDDVARGSAASDLVHIYSETVGTLDAALSGYSVVTQNQRTLAPEVWEGALVCSYYVILDPTGTGAGVTKTGSATFDGSALAFFGVKDDNCPDGCDAPGYLDDVLGVSGVNYTDDEDLGDQQPYYRWLETAGDNYDEVSISGSELTMTLLRTNTTWWDAFRVLVTPSP